MKWFGIFLGLMFLFSCDDKKVNPETKNVFEKEKIVEILVESSGGDIGISDQMYITKDSTFLVYSIAIDSTQDFNRAFKTDEKDWDFLMKNIDLKNFESAKDQPSRITFDGVDEIITIKTNKRKFTKMNAEKNATFDSISWKRFKTLEKFYEENKGKL